MRPYSSLFSQSVNSQRDNFEDADISPKSTLISKNITIDRRRTSVRLEPEMWSALKDISRRELCSIHDICSLINFKKKPLTSLTAAIRVFLMLYYRAASTHEGHMNAGHGNFEAMKKRVEASLSRNSISSVRSQNN